MKTAKEIFDSIAYFKSENEETKKAIPILEAIIITAMEKYADQFRKPAVIKSVCPRCSSNEDIRVKPITNDCMECGHTWQTVL